MSARAAQPRSVGSDAVDEAVALGERTLQALRGRLGEDHPFALSCATNLADCLHDAGKLAKAEALLRETAALLQRKLGPQHPDALVCEANLAVTLRGPTSLPRPWSCETGSWPTSAGCSGNIIPIRDGSGSGASATETSSHSRRDHRGGLLVTSHRSTSGSTWRALKWAAPD